MDPKQGQKVSLTFEYNCKRRVNVKINTFFFFLNNLEQEVCLV